MQIQLDHVAIYASDVVKSAAFYAALLGLEDAYPGEWGGAPTILMAPGSRTGVAIFPADAEHTERDNRPAGVIDHFAFRTTPEGLAAFRERAREIGVAFEDKEFGICRSVFVRDPDGVMIEITTYGTSVEPGG